MQDENEQAQVDVVEQEEQTSEEEVAEVEETEDESEAEAEEDNTVTLPKDEFTKLKRKAIAYDSNKGNKPAPKAEDSYLEDVFMVKDLSQEEYKTLKSEAEDLWIPFKKYLGSESGQTLLDKVRTKKKSVDSMEKLSSKSPVYKKFTQQDISKMSSAEMEKILSE